MRETLNFGIWPHFGEVKVDARPWLMARWKAQVDFLFVLTELVSLSITVPELLRRNVYGLAVFAGVDLFALKFYLDGVVPQQPFWGSEN